MMDKTIRKAIERVSFVGLCPWCMLGIWLINKHKGLAPVLRAGKGWRDFCLYVTPLRAPVMTPVELETLGLRVASRLGFVQCMELSIGTAIWLAAFGQRAELFVSRAAGPDFGLHAWLRWGKNNIFLGTASASALFSWNFDEAEDLCKRCSHTTEGVPLG